MHKALIQYIDTDAKSKSFLFDTMFSSCCVPWCLFKQQADALTNIDKYLGQYIISRVASIAVGIKFWNQFYMSGPN